MTVTCLKCGGEIDIGSVGSDGDDGEVYLTVTARRKFRESWSTYARLHVDCFRDAVDDGEFDAREWAEGVADE